MGHVINGKADGYGTLMTIKGAEYVGHVKDGLDVVGEKMTYLSGDIYEGEWQNDKQHGQGKLQVQMVLYMRALAEW